MLADEAKTLLGFSPNCRPSPSQVKAAYRRKVWETHPDRFPAHEKSNAECKFKMVSIYSLMYMPNYGYSYSYVVRTGVPRTYGGRRNQRLVGFPFLFIIVGTVALAGSNVASIAINSRVEFN
nr:DnaJ homolog subfamily B member 2 isoform X2 [Ipomoea batatas]